MKFAEKRLPATQEWHGTKLFVRENGERLITPMFLVILTLGGTDLLFAFDSIPAVYASPRTPTSSSRPTCRADGPAPALPHRRADGAPHLPD